MKNKIAAIVFAIALFFLILTLSIGLPIYIRPFFYAHIAPLDLEAESGFTRAEIIEAYNDVLDYLTLPGKPFCSGVMRKLSIAFCMVLLCTQSGKRCCSK